MSSSKHLQKRDYTQKKRRTSSAPSPFRSRTSIKFALALTSREMRRKNISKTFRWRSPGGSKRPSKRRNPLQPRVGELWRILSTIGLAPPCPEVEGEALVAIATTCKLPWLRRDD